MTNNYISSLEELYRHPDNGKDDVFLAAFASADNTFPIFIQRVEEFSGNRYKADCVGYKWGYHSSDVMRFTVYEDNLQRDVSRQFFTWQELSEHRWSPGGFAPLPLAFQAKCHFLPLQPWPVSFGRSDYEDRNWRFSGTSYAVSRIHARFLVARNVPTATDIYTQSYPITEPTFIEETD